MIFFYRRHLGFPHLGEDLRVHGGQGLEGQEERREEGYPGIPQPPRQLH